VWIPVSLYVLLADPKVDVVVSASSCPTFFLLGFLRSNSKFSPSLRQSLSWREPFPPLPSSRVSPSFVFNCFCWSSIFQEIVFSFLPLMRVNPFVFPPPAYCPGNLVFPFLFKLVLDFLCCEVKMDDLPLALLLSRSPPLQRSSADLFSFLELFQNLSFFSRVWKRFCPSWFPF